MIDRIAAFFRNNILSEETGQANPVDKIKLATAALLTEVMVIDRELSPDEKQAIHHLLCTHFQLSREQADELMALAKEEVDEATSLYQFTDLVNRYFSHAEKEELTIALWRVAYADGVLDKYEEATIRKIAELIYVPHSGFIRAKQRVLDGLQGG